MRKGGAAVEVGSTGPQHVPEGEEIVLAPEVERFIEDMRKLGICP